MTDSKGCSGFAREGISFAGFSDLEGVVSEQRLAPLAQAAAGLEPARHDRSDRNRQGLGDLLVGKIVEVAQGEDLAVVGAQAAEGLPEELRALLPLHVIGRQRTLRVFDLPVLALALVGALVPRRRRDRARLEPAF